MKRALLLIVPMLVCGPAGTAHAEVLSAGHHGRFTGSTVEWTSQVRFDHAESTVNLATPLPRDVVVLGGSPTPSPVRDSNGAVIGFDLAVSSAAVDLYLSQPATKGDITLAAPLVASDVVQRVTVEGARFDPAPALGLERRVDDVRSADITFRERRRCDKALGKGALGDRIYLVADARIVDGGGLVGSLRQRGQVRPVVVAAIAGVFGVAVLLMVAAIRALDRVAQAEAVDAYIRHEFVDWQGLGKHGRPEASADGVTRPRQS